MSDEALKGKDGSVHPVIFDAYYPSMDNWLNQRPVFLLSHHILMTKSPFLEIIFKATFLKKNLACAIRTDILSKQSFNPK